ncbi:C4-dicarboxylate ABC transporter [Sulfurifustis variabilis]|uniref:C4-dicarboxylate ABC transporter n=1 Tax=Sulfurifustis variabilis TaxID=1675686 RepID=A0A1C7AF88_9GAMM|nr:TRAP transporter substrate-binding protein [Sulfurifustis variabilis]BAU49932.1 C4-dicarboxylate ABC transporter [Sulfurifustis variabilis]
MSDKKPKKRQIQSTEPSKSRRRFLAGAAASAAGAATLSFPMVSRAQTVSMRFQSTWPTKDIFHEYALDYAKKVNDMSGGRLKIEVLPAGAVVKAFDLIDAVNKGTLDGGHGVSAYWYGKNSAYSLFGTGPSFGMDANTLLAWVEYGGGKELYDELQHKIMKFDVVGFLYGPMPTQPLGWFKKPVKSSSELKNLKFRTVGLSVDVFKELGAAVVALPGGEIVPALDRGLIEAAEFNNASSDRLLGFPDVSKICMLQSYHQPLECFEILFNGKKYNALPNELKSIIRYAAQASSADMSWKAIDRYSQDYIGMKTKDGVKFYKTPNEILQAQLKAWDAVIAKKSAENPFFAKVVESQRKFAERAVAWSEDTIVSPTLAYNHYFGKKKG